MYKKLSQTADRIEAVLRDRRAPASVVGGKVLPGFVEMLLRPDPGTKVNQVKALQADLALALGNNNVRVAQSGIHLAIQIPSEQRRQVFLSTLIAGMDQIPPHTAVLGLSEDGSPLMAKLSSPDVAHVLIAGTTGSVKTSLAQSMLLSLARANGIPATDVYVFDASRQSNRVSANVSGFAGTTRISLNDNLLKRCSLPGIESTMGHEMGHYVLNHQFKGMVLSGVLIVVMFWLLDRKSVV